VFFEKDALSCVNIANANIANVNVANVNIKSPQHPSTIACVSRSFESIHGEYSGCFDFDIMPVERSVDTALLGNDRIHIASVRKRRSNSIPSH
jgi:hypothetical protein